MSPTDRKAQILDHAESLLCQVGFASFSYQDLATRVNIAKPSIHHHFPSKEALGLALLERYHGMLTGMREQIAAKSSSAAEQFSSFLKMADDKHGDCEICPLGALQSDFESLPGTWRRRKSWRLPSSFASTLRCITSTPFLSRVVRRQSVATANALASWRDTTCWSAAMQSTLNSKRQVRMQDTERDRSSLVRLRRHHGI